MTNNLLIRIIKNDGSISSVEKIEGIEFDLLGKNNTITIHENTKFEGCYFTLSGNMTIVIGESNFSIVNLRIWGKDSEITIGKHFSCWGVEIRCHEPKSKISIGENCMFAEEILIYPTDGHAIFDDNGELLNLAKPILIGDHCWCGRRSILLKGTEIANNTIIGAASVVNKKFKESNVIIAGNPARIVKKKINWNRWNPYDYQNKMNKNK